MSKKIPVIVGLGGINAAGRSSGFHAYKRMVYEALSDEVMQSTWQDLATRMGIPQTADYVQTIVNGTLMRKIDAFDAEAVPGYFTAPLAGKTHSISFELSQFKLPEPLPIGWAVTSIDDSTVRVEVQQTEEVLLPISQKLDVTTGGNIPNGFDPGAMYNSRNHPRGLKLAVYGISDAINSLGMDWDVIMEHVAPDQVSVYAGGALSQADPDSLTGLAVNSTIGKRFNSKMMALSFAEMPADFINSYVINSVGTTGTSIGACATFLYNLRQGIQDIQSGQARVVIVGTAEAPVRPDVMQGFSQMGALAKDEDLAKLDDADQPNHARACRPFAENAGFAIAESAQFIVLMDDDLALKTGANILGSVADVFVNADANKKSITAPGIGNYVTVAKAAALCKELLGQEGLQQTYVQSHGTGTPQNRVTESHILNEVAKTFGIKDWPVAAIKAYVGHSIASAAGDQISAALGVWQFGVLPGIKSITEIAGDVHHDHLKILLDHQKVDELRAVIINSKGFGGNNASAVLLSPKETMQRLQAQYGAEAWAEYHTKHKHVAQETAKRDQLACQGDERIIYNFGQSVLSEDKLELTEEGIRFADSGRFIPFK